MRALIGEIATWPADVLEMRRGARMFKRPQPGLMDYLRPRKSFFYQAWKMIRWPVITEARLIALFARTRHPRRRTPQHSDGGPYR